MAKKKAANLTRLESEIMAVAWEYQPDSVCVRDIVDAINQQRAQAREKQLAYNTVQTIVTILKQKKMLRLVDGPGRAHRFVPTVSRGEATQSILADLSKRVFGGQLQPMIHQLIDDANLTTDELAELKKWVDSKLRDSRDNKS